MPKIQNKEEKSKLVRRAGEIMEAKGIEPLDLICESLTTAMPIPRDKSAKRSALSTNYEYTPDGKAMRPNIRLRMEWAMFLASLKHPKIKAAEVADTEDRNVTVIIRNFGKDEDDEPSAPMNPPALGDGPT